MVPLADCPEVLRLFRAIPPTRRVATLSMEADDAAATELRAYHHTPAGLRTPAAEAEHLHRRLERAGRAAARPGPPDPVAAHLVWEAARAVARLAVRVAARSGELAQLLGTLGQMDETADAVGGPGYIVADLEAYERLTGRATTLAGGIERAVVADTLRRYRLTVLADLYDADESAFHQLVEVGRRLLTASGPDRPWPRDEGWF